MGDVDMMAEIMTEYYGQTGQVMAALLSAMSFTAAGMIREQFYDEENLLVVLIIAVLMMNVFGVVGSACKVILRRGVAEAYHSSVVEKRNSAATVVPVSENHRLTIDYTVPHLIDVVYNPVEILIDMSSFLSRMFAQLNGMLLMTWFRGLSMVAMIPTFVLFSIARQAYNSSKAPETPPPSPVQARKKR